MFNNHGSIWRKWDLHVHTPLDHEWINRPVLATEEDKKKFAKEYIAFALAQNLAVIAITDHNFCNNVEESLIPYITVEAKANDITILPGFEITVKDGSGIHLLVVFKENTALNEIYEIVKRLFPLNTILMPPSGIVPVCEKDIDGLKEVLDASNLDYVLIFAHADSSNGVLQPKTIDGTRRIQEWQKDFIKVCQISKAPSQFTQGSFLHNLVNDLDDRYKREITYICASDCRTIDKADQTEGRHHLGQKFTWIKANPGLEGLKEIQFERTLRTRIQDTFPNPRVPYEIIKEVRFIIDDVSEKSDFTPESIKLNPDLNVVIGGKSSGKSLLLYQIANTVDPKQVNNKEEKPDKYSFLKRKIDFEVIWENGTKQLLSENNTPGSSNYSILYIPQSYIQRLADTEGKRTRREVGEIIRDILKQKQAYNKYYSDFVAEVKRLDTTRESFISQYISALDIYKSSLDSIKIVGDKTAISGYILQLKSEVEKLKHNSEVTSEIQEEYNLLRERAQALNARLIALNADKEKIQYFKYTFDRLSNELITNRNQLISELKTDSLKGTLSELLDPIITLQNISSSLDIDILDDTNGQILKAENVIKAELEEVNEKIKPLAERFTSNEEIEKLETIIAEQLTKLERVKVLEGEVKIKEEQKNIAKKKLLDEYRATYDQYIAIVKKLNERGAEISDLKLTGSVKFYTKRYFNRLSQHIAVRGKSWKAVEDAALFDMEEDISNISDIELMISSLSKLFDSVIDDTIVPKGGATKRDILNVLFRDEFFDYWEILSGGDEIANMSPGKAGLVLLKLLIDLSDSKCPILIDQPEDNLDNRSIYTDLVQYIRSKKTQRQFIVVTHNPNIVVGADADNVIVANQNDQDPKRKNKYYRFDYISGALEYSFTKKSDDNILTSMGIREHVTDILEGGKEAFQKRETKYRYD